MMLGLRTVGGGQGGVEAHVDNLVDELDKLGLSVLVAVRSSYADTGWERGQATRFIPFWAPRSQNWEAVVHSLIVSFYAMIHRPRIVHVHAIGPSLIVPLLRLAGLRVVTTHHGEDYNREKWGYLASQALRIGERFQAAFASARICVSRSLALRLTGEYGKPFDYVPNGVRPAKPVVETHELAKYGLVPGEYVLTVSRLVPEKRHLDLIAAFETLGRPNLRLAIVGGTNQATAYSDSLAARASAAPNVVMTGMLTGVPLYQLFSHAGVFALPSTHEGLPIALLEAMAFGRNVVASDIEPNLDIGLPAECYHKVGDIADLACKLESALSNDVLTRAGRDWSELLATFDWTAIARRTLEIYAEVSPYISVAI
jgi:glycosyltransferase involved in cell wall biosynthesis